MSKKESNKNIYIFWGAIILIVIIVLLVIFLPRTNFSRTYENMHQISVSLNKEDSHNNKISYYATQFSVSSLTTDKKNKALALLNLQYSMEHSTNYNLTALQFVEKKQDFKKLYDAQIATYNTAQNGLETFRTYCQDYVNKWFDGSTPFNDLYFNQVFDVFVEKYQEAIQQLADFYVATAEYLTLNATQGIEITSSNLEKNEQFMKQVQEQAHLETLNPSKCSEIYTNTHSTQSIYFKFN